MNYTIELVDTTASPTKLLACYEAADGDELGAKMGALGTLGELDREGVEARVSVE